MSTSATLPPFHLDNRIAESPVVAMRFQLGGRAREIEALALALVAEVNAATSERARQRLELVEAEADRQQLLSRINTVPREIVLAAFDRSALLAMRVRAAAERIDGLQSRIEGLRDQARMLRELSAAVAGLDDVPRVGDAPAIRYRQAERQLLHLVDQDLESTAREVISGPMEQLADVALAIELAGRRVTSAPAEAAEDVAHCKEATRSALVDMNRLLFRISPQGLEAEGLAEAVRRLLADIDGVKARLLVLGDEQELAPAVALAAFRIIDQAVTNASRHSHAAAVEVILGYANHRLMVVVKDDGEGFDVAATEARQGRNDCLGMITMHERAEILGGTCEVRSILGVGTEVRASFDINAG